MTKTVKNIVCPRCSGLGYTTEHFSYIYTDHVHTACPACAGHGVLVETTTVSITKLEKPDDIYPYPVPKHDPVPPSGAAAVALLN